MRRLPQRIRVGGAESIWREAIGRPFAKARLFVILEILPWLQ